MIESKEQKKMRSKAEKECDRFEKVVPVSWPNPRAYCCVEMDDDDLKKEILRLDRLLTSVEAAKL